MPTILGFLAFDKKSRKFKKFRNELVNSVKIELERTAIDTDKLFKKVSAGIHNRTICPSKSENDISPEFVELAHTILELPPKVGAYLSTLAFGIHLFKNSLSLWGQGEIMMVYESMRKIDSKNTEKTAELLAFALYMMDSRFIAHDTYIHMMDPDMQEMTRMKLKQINENLSEIIIEG